MTLSLAKTTFESLERFWEINPLDFLLQTASSSSSASAGRAGGTDAAKEWSSTLSPSPVTGSTRDNRFLTYIL
jgi:hypothetical protein